MVAKRYKRGVKPKGMVMPKVAVPAEPSDSIIASFITKHQFIPSINAVVNDIALSITSSETNIKAVERKKDTLHWT